MTGRQTPLAPPADLDALATLTWHYEHPRAAALACHRQGGIVIGFTSNTVPWEIIRASGAFPVLVTAAHDETPLADPIVEPVFDRRIRSIIEDILGGQWSFLRQLVIPRTSEWEHKLYLYLLEVRRQSRLRGSAASARQAQRGSADPAGRAQRGSAASATQAPKHRALPVPYLYDLLHTRSSNAARHGLGRTEQLVRDLATVTSRRAGAGALRAAIRESNAARAAIRGLLRHRRGAAPRLSGSEALALIGAWYVMDRGQYARLATKAAAIVGRRPALKGPRVLIKGTPLDHRGLHQALERHGAVVVAEDDWWGSRSAGRDITGARPLTAIFRKYYLDAPSPRVFPSAVADAWFVRAIRDRIDGVVYYLPPDDDVLGWDYPRHRRLLDERGIPVILIREDARHLSADIDARLAAFVGQLRGTQSAGSNQQ